MGHSKRIYDLLLKLWPLYKVGLWLGKQPGVGYLMQPVFSQKIHQVTMIPVNEAIAIGEQTVMPYSLLMQLVEQSSTCFIMQECVCRKHESCQHHPIDLGCLFLGDGAAQIHPSMGKVCEVEQAKQHIKRGLRAGLYPLIAHTVIDAFTLGISYRRMLTVCFCCECCCMVQRGLRDGPKSLLQVIQPLPGLRLTVGEECEACGLCIQKCPVGAISSNHRGVEINGACKGCGICVQECPYGAIKLEFHGKRDLLEEFGQRIGNYADISRLQGKSKPSLKP
jgi:UDP-glucose 4-epimerase